MNDNQPLAPARRVRYVPALDGLRGISTPGTIYTHFAIFLGYLPTAPGWIEHAGPFTLNIEMFFALSGALITSLLVSEHQRSGAVRLDTFYLRRSRRLGPALIAVLPLVLIGRYLLPGTALVPPFGTVPWLTVASVLLFLGNWRLAGHQAGLGWLGPAWTLGIEEQFYLTWPTLLWLSLRHNWPRRATLLALGLAIVVSVAGGVLLYQHYGWGTALYMTPTELPPILMGCALGYALTTTPDGGLARLLRSPLVGLTGLAGMVIFSIEGYKQITLLADGGFAVYGVFACLLIGHCMVAAGQPSLVSRVFGWKPFVVMGQISYEAYLVHLVVILAVLQVAPTLPVNDMVLVDLALIAAMSAAFYYFVEDPIRRRGWKVLVGRGAARPVADPAAQSRRRFRPGVLAGTAVGLAAVAAVATVSLNVHRHGSAPLAFLSQSAGNDVGAGPGDVSSGRPAVPTVSGLTPVSGPVAGGTRVTIHGHGFTKTAQVDLGPVALSGVTWVNDRTLVVTIPPAAHVKAAAAGSVTALHGLREPITVTTSGGRTGASPMSTFTYL